jgi:hypothetical protein
LTSKGWTVSQIYDRLPVLLQERLLEPDLHPTTARRKALNLVVQALFVHVDSGLVQRKRTRLKNAARAGIDAMVDVYRLSK